MKTGSLFLTLIFTGISAYFIYFACTLETSVPTNDSTGVLGADRVANLQLMQIQTLDLQIGLAAGIIAAIFWATTMIVTVIEMRLNSPPLAE